MADRTDDPGTVAAVYAYALVRFGAWDQRRLAAAGVKPRIVRLGTAVDRLQSLGDAGYAFRGHRSLVAAEAAAIDLIRNCLYEEFTACPETPFARAQRRLLIDSVWLPTADEATVRRLIADLASPDEETCWYAVGAMRTLEEPDAVGPLLAVLERVRGMPDSSESYPAARTVGSALRSSLTDDQVPLALRLVDHEDPEVGRMAANLLQRAADHAPATESPGLRLAALRPFLRSIGADPMPTDRDEVRRRLTAFLAEDPVNHHVLKVLKQWGDESCLPALTKVLGRSRSADVRDMAAETIRAIGGDDALRRAVLDVLRDPEARPRVAALYAGRLRLTEAVPDLAAIVRDRRGDEYDAAAAALVSLGAREAAPALAEALAGGPGYHSELIRHITRLGPDPAVETLIAAARNPYTRTVALDALARCRDPRAVDIVVTALLDGAVRMALVRPLAERGEPATVGALIHVVTTTDDRRIRQVATRGIARAGQIDPDAVAPRLTALFGSAAVRTAKIWLLGRLKPTRAGEQLADLTRAGRDSDERVRAEAARSLALVGTPEALEVLRGMRDDASRHVRACVEGRLRTG